VSDTAAAAAMAALTARLEAANRARILGYLRRTVPHRLGVSADSVVVTLSDDGTTIGIAAMSRDRCPAQTSGTVADALAGLPQWTEDRCSELTTQIVDVQATGQTRRAL
jgi:ribosome modulation factor